MKLKPLNDRVVVKRIEEEQVTAGGIIIPDTAKEKPIQGEVISVGSGKLMEDGTQTAIGRESGRPGAVQQVCRHGYQGRRR